jgi:hypothetical protein
MKETNINEWLVSKFQENDWVLIKAANPKEAALEYSIIHMEKQECEPEKVLVLPYEPYVLTRNVSYDIEKEK